MGWLNTLLDVGILAGQWSSMNKLETLKQQGAEAAMVQAVLRELRNQIFNYKQSAEEIVGAEVQNPKRAAGAMKLLGLQLKESGITPELFIDLSDKEYVAATTRFIRDNGNRMLGSLPVDQQAEVNAFAAAAIRLPDYDYYLSNYDDGYRYRAALPDAQKYGIAQNGCIALLVGYIGIAVFGAAGAAVGAVLRMGDIGFILGLVGWFVFMRTYTATRKQRAAAKKTVDALQNKIDLDRFNAIDAEFNGDRERVANVRQQARLLVDVFFGNATPAALPLAATPDTSSVAVQPQSAAISTATCPACGAPYPSGAKFCMKCGQSLNK
jgi:hypothetical protein